MGDRIAVLAPLAGGHRSNLMQYGTPDQVYARPENLFVARFIGTPRMNVVTLPVENGALMFGSQRLPLPDAAARLPAIALGQRPEHLRLVADAEPGLPGTVEHVENLGHERVLTIASAAGALILRETRGAQAAAVGQPLRVALDPAHLHLFDPQTELRLD